MSGALCVSVGLVLFFLRPHKQMADNTSVTSNTEQPAAPEASNNGGDAPASPPENRDEKIQPTGSPPEEENSSSDAPVEETYFIKGDRYQGKPHFSFFGFSFILGFNQVQCEMDYQME
jgi:hypothetical protein